MAYVLNQLPFFLQCVTVLFVYVFKQLLVFYIVFLYIYKRIRYAPRS